MILLFCISALVVWVVFWDWYTSDEINFEIKCNKETRAFNARAENRNKEFKKRTEELFRTMKVMSASVSADGETFRIHYEHYGHKKTHSTFLIRD